MIRPVMLLHFMSPSSSSISRTKMTSMMTPSKPKSRLHTDWLESSSQSFYLTSSLTWQSRFCHNTRIFHKARLPRLFVHFSIRPWSSQEEIAMNLWLSFQGISLIGVKRRADHFWEWKLKISSLSFCLNSQNIKILWSSWINCSMSLRRRMINSWLLNHNS